MNDSVPISDSYRDAAFDALKLQALLGTLRLLILDCGETARMCGVAILLAIPGGRATS